MNIITKESLKKEFIGSIKKMKNHPFLKLNLKTDSYSSLEFFINQFLLIVESCNSFVTNDNMLIISQINHKLKEINCTLSLISTNEDANKKEIIVLKDLLIILDYLPKIKNTKDNKSFFNLKQKFEKTFPNETVC